MTTQAIAVFVLLAASFPSFISATTQYNNDAHPEAILFGPADTSGTGTRIRGMRETRNADFILGGLFPVHSRGYCEQFNRINIVEAMLSLHWTLSILTRIFYRILNLVTIFETPVLLSRLVWMKLPI